MAEYVYGYGKTKHILDSARQPDDAFRETVGLCGAFGGYPFEEPERPLCMRCEKIAARLDVQGD